MKFRKIHICINEGFSLNMLGNEGAVCALSTFDKSRARILLRNSPTTSDLREEEEGAPAPT